MKKVLVVCVVVTIVLAVSTANANTIASSTMVFQGNLTDNGDGTYTGNIMSVQEFDVYAKVGSVVNSSVSSIDKGTVGADHDAWPLWTPDTPDASSDPGDSSDGYYALSLDGTTWGVKYLSTKDVPTSAPATGHDGNPTIPLGGTVDWGTGLAIETGQNWYAAWSWTSGDTPAYEQVILEYLGFDMSISPLGGGSYEVSLTPVPEPATLCLLGLGGLLLRRKRSM